MSTAIKQRLFEPGHAGIFVGGLWRPAADGGDMDVYDPATGDVIAVVADGTSSDALDCVEAAAATFDAWARTSPRRRSGILLAASQLMIERLDELADVIVAENGKTLDDARAEVGYATELFRWYAEETVRMRGSVQSSPDGSNKLVVMHQPVGVSLVVTPWNFPAATISRRIGAALAAGCTVVVKPSSQTPMTALAIAAILDEAGVPPGVVNVLPSLRSNEVVRAMLEDGRVRQLSFTGSAEVARSLVAPASPHLVSSSIECGGSAPFLVFSDADLGAAVAGAMTAIIHNTGQACMSANRLYVADAVVDEFTDRLSARMAALRVGPGADGASQVGPLINQATRSKVSSLVDQAVRSGATIRTGGQEIQGRGFFYAPTVLSDVDGAAAIMHKEVFGPVAPITTFRSDSEAVEFANGGTGPVAYIYTSDLARGLRIGEGLESALVGLNRGIASAPAAPLSGLMHGGPAADGGVDGLLEYIKTKRIAVQWARP